MSTETATTGATTLGNASRVVSWYSRQDVSRYDSRELRHRVVELHITEASVVSELATGMYYTPAASISVYGEAAVRALRDACNAALGEEKP